jgi:hypothetical protein
VIKNKINRFLLVFISTFLFIFAIFISTIQV